MPTLANYSTIQDKWFKLAAGEDIQQFKFQLPPSARNYPAILAFRVEEGKGWGLEFMVELNGFNVYQGQVDVCPAPLRTVHEIVEVKNPPVLANGVNTIEFKLNGSFGNVTLSDVVLWWKQDV
jgi:hypothetical protein